MVYDASCGSVLMPPCAFPQAYVRSHCLTAIYVLGFLRKCKARGAEISDVGELIQAFQLIMQQVPCVHIPYTVHPIPSHPTNFPLSQACSPSSSLRLPSPRT